MRVFSWTLCVAAVLTGASQIQAAVPKAAPTQPIPSAPKTAPAVPAPAAPAPTAPGLQTDKDKISYSMGFDIGRKIGKDFKANGVDMDPAVFAQGIKEGLSGLKPTLTEDEMKKVMEAFRKQMIADAPKKAAEQAAKNKKDGEDFLAANGMKPGVTTTKSGLQIKVIKEGTGDTPKPTDTVKTHYHGTLIDGTVFDSSVERNEPVTFPVKGVIPGWTEALQLMKVGEKAQLFIPSDLAYGEDGSPPDIGPNSALVFEIELLGIEKPAPKKGLPEGLLPPGIDKDK